PLADFGTQPWIVESFSDFHRTACSIETLRYLRSYQADIAPTGVKSGQGIIGRHLAKQRFSLTKMHFGPRQVDERVLKKVTQPRMDVGNLGRHSQLLVDRECILQVLQYLPPTNGQRSAQTHKDLCALRIDLPLFLVQMQSVRPP